MSSSTAACTIQWGVAKHCIEKGDMFGELHFEVLIVIGFALGNLVFYFGKDTIMHFFFLLSLLPVLIVCMSSSKMLYKMYNIIQICSYSMFSRFNILSLEFFLSFSDD